jgi:hypothetical protein
MEDVPQIEHHLEDIKNGKISFNQLRKLVLQMMKPKTSLAAGNGGRANE